MNSINDKNLFQKLVAYTFGNLSSQEEKQLDSYIEEHPEAAEMAETLSAYCYKENLQNPDQLNERLAADQQFYLKHVKSTASAPGKQKTMRRWWWLAAAAAVLLLAVQLWYFYNTPPAVQFNEQIYAFHEREEGKVKEASRGTTDWTVDFVNEDFSVALGKLESQFKEDPKNLTGGEMFYLSALYIWQSPPNVEGLQNVLTHLPKGSPNYQAVVVEMQKAGIEL